jgi:hypothetical protein
MYLAAPHDAEAWPEVQMGLSSRLQPDLMGALTVQDKKYNLLKDKV